MRSAALDALLGETSAKIWLPEIGRALVDNPDVRGKEDVACRLGSMRCDALSRGKTPHENSPCPNMSLGGMGAGTTPACFCFGRVGLKFAENRL